MNPLEELKRRLDSLGDVRYESDRSSLSVYPADANGFPVRVMKNSNTYTVFLAGWHEDFESPEETLDVFGFGLSDLCRLREYRRGDFAYKWTVESLEGGKWQEYSTTGLLIFPFWRRPEMHYLQNRFLSQQR
jgi:hypothetical protein